MVEITGAEWAVIQSIRNVQEETGHGEIIICVRDSEVTHWDDKIIHRVTQEMKAKRITAIVN